MEAADLAPPWCTASVPIGGKDWDFEDRAGKHSGWEGKRFLEAWPGKTSGHKEGWSKVDPSFLGVQNRGRTHGLCLMRRQVALRGEQVKGARGAPPGSRRLPAARRPPPWLPLLEPL